MNAKTLKEWNVASGDFNRNKETDYEQNFHSAKIHNKLFEKRILLVFSFTCIALVLLVLEMITKN